MPPRASLPDRSPRLGGESFQNRRIATKPEGPSGVCFNARACRFCCLANPPRTVSARSTRNTSLRSFGVDRFPMQRLSENEEAFTVRGRYKKPVQPVRPLFEEEEHQQAPPKVNLATPSSVSRGLEAVRVPFARSLSSHLSSFRSLPQTLVQGELPWHSQLVPVAVPLPPSGATTTLYKPCWFRLACLRRARVPGRSALP